MKQDDIFEACARAAHEANRSYCMALGDHSQEHWEKAPTWARDSAREGVVGVLIRGNGPRESHGAWLAAKERDGWRWGPLKDPTIKTHPCFRPYDELPEDQRAKDTIFVTVVRTMAAALGWMP